MSEFSKKYLDVSGKYLILMVAAIVSVVLHLPLFRIPYLSVMNSSRAPRKLRDRLTWGARRAVTSNSELSKAFKTNKALIIYYSATGNTKKVALAIERGVRKGGMKPTVKKISEANEEDFFDYDLICFGTPVLHTIPPPPVVKFIRALMKKYKGEFQLPARKIPGKNALVFVTFSGPHCGVVEAVPAGKYVHAFFGHLGFEVKGEWYVVGEFHAWKAGSIRGFLGDIRGRPNEQDLARIEKKTIKLTELLKLDEG